MADISKIKLPDNSEYDIKDATARAQSGVTGVKGNSESSYRTGNVNVTAANVGAVAKSGDTMTGKLTLQSNQYEDSYSAGALDLKNSNILGVNGIYTADAAENGSEGINFYRDSTHVDSLHARTGHLYFTPNRILKDSGTASEVVVKGISTFQESYLEWGGKNFSASYGCIDAAMVDVLGANRFAFLKAAGIAIEYSTDGGETWTDYAATDANKTALFARGQSFHLGKASSKTGNNINNQLRVIISTSPAGIYSTLNKFAIYMSTNGNTTQARIDIAVENTPDTWMQKLDWTGVGGWSGWNILNVPSFTTYGNSPASQYGRIRFTFRQTTVNSSYASPSISRIMAFGGVGWSVPSQMASDGHLYSYDYAQNATFPAKVIATDYAGNIDGSAFYNKNATGLNANNIDSNGIGYYTSNGPATSLGATTNDGAIITQKYSSAWQTQIAQDYRNGGLFVRGKSSGTWQSWQKVYDSAHKPSLSADVTGTLPVANGGTGKTTAKDAANQFMNALDTGSSTPVDADYYISQYVGGGTSTTTYHRRPMSALWAYIKGKIESIVLSTSTSSTSTTTAATSSAVKTAYDLANTANGTANTALSGVNGTLIYDHTYTISNGVATFTPHVYQKGEEVTTNYAKSCFTWKYRLSSDVTTTPTYITLTTNNNRGCTVNISSLGYGGHVIGIFTPPES